MPEGPEIRRAASRIGLVIEGRIIEDAFFARPDLSVRTHDIVGQSVVAVTCRGKAMLTAFTAGLYLYTHNQLYGRWYIARRGTLPATNRSLRVALHTREHSALLYSASEIEILDTDGIAQHPYLAKLGPDALDESVHWRDVLAQLRSPAFSRRSLSALYLDQAFIAGIGNYLRTEILHYARLHPSLRPLDLSRAEQGHLARLTLSLTRQSYQTAGLTNTPARIRHLKLQGARRNDYRFAAFARHSKPCYTCSQPIERINANSRRLYLCPNCQPDRNSRRQLSANTSKES